jgi:hypothetical protein
MLHPSFGYFQPVKWDRVSSINLDSMCFSGKPVFLSAYRACLGQVGLGDDIYSMMYPLLVGTASSVISTLWQIGDETCALRTQRYYMHIAHMQGW